MTTSDGVRPLTAAEMEVLRGPNGLREAATAARDGLALYVGVRGQPDGVFDFRRTVERLDVALGATLDEARAGSLDAAWQEAEAALPEGYELHLSWVTGHWALGPDKAYLASTAWTGEDYRPGVFQYGDTPAAALRALAAALREAQP